MGVSTLRKRGHEKGDIYVGGWMRWGVSRSRTPKHGIMHIGPCQYTCQPMSRFQQRRTLQAHTFDVADPRFMRPRSLRDIQTSENRAVDHHVSEHVGSVMHPGARSSKGSARLGGASALPCVSLPLNASRKYGRLSVALFQDNPKHGLQQLCPARLRSKMLAFRQYGNSRV
ncbi:hypothetical protein CALCODRAFT_190188 [Calocera cornea HHB12733]|uniref:Uncharacterized protein n=1 Tax=Calocera cornea HHB12733 TaxID=1353952 RepID=A0A165C810_9BASI|nr:hypothetical protein CALCODRAFT_190188 [Calocera cornea HHB12733]